MSEILLTQDSLRLCELESTIEQGLKTFVDVGNALLEIRDARLYKEAHSTFEEYCNERWGMSRIHAHRTIEAAQVASNLLPMGNIPTNERQTRPLTGLEPAEQRTVWESAVRSAPNGRVTAAHVQSVVDSHKADCEPSLPHVAHNSGNNEWYTPSEYIEAARAVMGGIDLDPASSEIANAVVGAATYYTAEDNGLSMPWFGCVWMNPPYSGDLVGDFADKMAWEFREDNVSEAIVLINNATETKWFRTLIDVGAAVVFPSSRVRFWKPDGELGAPLQGQAIVYLGNDPERFLASFRGFGWGATL